MRGAMAVRADFLDQRLRADALNGRFGSRVDIQQKQTVGLMESGSEFFG